MCSPEELYCEDEDTAMICPDGYFVPLECDPYCKETYGEEAYAVGCDADAEDLAVLDNVEREIAMFERYADFYARICVAVHDLVADPEWHNLAVFAHGGTNAAILGWVTGLGLPAFGLLDQATCCLNIIDFDVDKDGQVVRKTLRAMNVTADDPVMRDRHSGDMEMLASMILQGVANN